MSILNFLLWISFNALFSINTLSYCMDTAVSDNQINYRYNKSAKSLRWLVFVECCRSNNFSVDNIPEPLQILSIIFKKNDLDLFSTIKNIILLRQSIFNIIQEIKNIENYDVRLLDINKMNLVDAMLNTQGAIEFILENNLELFESLYRVTRSGEVNKYGKYILSYAIKHRDFYIFKTIFKTYSQILDKETIETLATEFLLKIIIKSNDKSSNFTKKTGKFLLKHGADPYNTSVKTYVEASLNNLEEEIDIFDIQAEINYEKARIESLYNYILREHLAYL